MNVAIKACLGLLLSSAASAERQPLDASQTPRVHFMIFFDWGKLAITRDAEAALDDSAAAWRARPGGPVEIEGHSDRSGPAAANRRAARLRAMAVRDELVRRGVPAALIAVRSEGEERPLIATEDGVREVQNRRVDINIGRR